MTDRPPPQIVVTPNGTYIVTGEVPLAVQIIEANAAGESWEWAEGKSWEAKATYALCRCGHSGHAPFCDGTHTEMKYHDGLS
jgi:CDGSH-type Zn-finger protein